MTQEQCNTFRNNSYLNLALTLREFEDISKKKETIIYTDFNYKNKFSKRFSYALRNRWQTQGDLFGYKMTLRQKFSINYNIKKSKLNPSIATEYFLTLKDGINKMRSSVALGYPFTKKLDFELVYRIQQQFYVNNPQTLFIFEGKLAYNL